MRYYQKIIILELIVGLSHFMGVILEVIIKLWNHSLYNLCIQLVINLIRKIKINLIFSLSFLGFIKEYLLVIRLEFSQGKVGKGFRDRKLKIKSKLHLILIFLLEDMGLMGFNCHSIAILRVLLWSTNVVLWRRNRMWDIDVDFNHILGTNLIIQLTPILLMQLTTILIIYQTRYLNIIIEVSWRSGAIDTQYSVWLSCS